MARVPINAEEQNPPTVVHTACWSPRVVSVTLPRGYPWAWGCGEVCTIGSCKLDRTGSNQHNPGCEGRTALASAVGGNLLRCDLQTEIGVTTSHALIAKKTVKAKGAADGRVLPWGHRV